MAELINPPTTRVCRFSKKRAGGGGRGEDDPGLMARHICSVWVSRFHVLMVFYVAPRGRSISLLVASSGVVFSPVLLASPMLLKSGAEA